MEPIQSQPSANCGIKPGRLEFESFGTQSQGTAKEPILRSVLDGDVLRRPVDALFNGIRGNKGSAREREHPQESDLKGPCH